MTHEKRNHPCARASLGRILALVCLCLGCATASLQSQPTENSTLLEAYTRAERFMSSEMDDLVYNAQVQAHWLDDGSRFWYRSDSRGKREFILVDPEKALKDPAFDHARLSKSLSLAVGKECDASKLPFASIQFVDQEKAIVFRAERGYWKCDLDTYECVEAEVPEQPSGNQRRADHRLEGRGPGDGGEGSESPDHKWIAFLKDNNVYLRSKGTGEETRLTDDGEPKDTYSAIVWRLDSKKLVAFRTQPGDNLEMYMIESSPSDSLRPKLRKQVYALPGDKLDTHETWILDIGSRERVRAQADRIDWGGPPQLHWRPDNRHFVYEQIHRGHQRDRVIEVDSETGAARTIIDERSETFLPLDDNYVYYLDGSGEIIWASERDGWRHLYLYDAQTGRVKNQITRGEWVVRGVEKVDERKREITFTASGMDPGRDPYLVHWFRVGFDGNGLVRLTEGDGNHRLSFSPDGECYIDAYSRVDMAPVSELRRTADGSLVMTLEKADTHDLLATGWKWPEPFCVKGRDGKTDIWGVIFRPSNLDESKKYPVIENIYAGPQGSFVPKAFSPRYGSQALAELGFIVVQIDGMGTANRSKAFHDVAYHNLADSGFADRIAWMRAAAERYPYMDLSRVGIYGHSAGGYNAARALIDHPEFYKVAVSMSGNHDHRTDKVWWNEIWMGYPVGEHYVEQSNVTQAYRLQGKLYLIHGEMDDNVNLSASTMQFVNALIKANKDFDMLIVPGAGHGLGPYVTRKMWDYFVTNLQGVTPPKEYELGPSPAGECTITIRNLLDKPVAIYWVEPEGTLRKYHDLDPGEEIKQHTYFGHAWEAHVDGKAVSWFQAENGDLEWDIGP
jgi:dipeptidyl aminopeptidase/acylaminoacyl peptidase